MRFLRTLAAAVVIAICSLGGGKLALATAQIGSGSVVLFPGDSITASYLWFAATGGLVDQINAKMTTYTANFYAVSVGAQVQAVSVGGSRPATQGSGVAVPRAAVSTLNTAVSGYTTSDVLANVSTMITSQSSAKVIVMDIGTNDVASLVPLSTSQSNLQAIIAATRAWKPTIPIVLVSVLTFSETWTAGPPLAWVDTSSPVDAFNSMEASVCSGDTYCTFVDIRAPALIWESANNTPAPGVASGKLLVDDRHPTTTGKVQMGNWTMGAFSVQP